MSDRDMYRRLHQVETDTQVLTSKVASLGEGFEEVTSTVVELADSISALARQLEPSTVRSWLAVEDEEKARLYLADLQKWLSEVWVHYDSAPLPECWAYHPGVVEELWVLMNLHRSVFRKGGTWQALADWQDRYRPHVVERLAKLAARCSLARHEQGAESDPADERAVPDQFDPGAVARAWTAGRGVPYATQAGPAFPVDRSDA